MMHHVTQHAWQGHLLVLVLQLLQLVCQLSYLCSGAHAQGLLHKQAHARSCHFQLQQGAQNQAAAVKRS